MSSLDMALDAIIWLKVDKGCYLHCTEYGYSWRADAIGYNGKDMIEIEVKTSWSDFKADFKNKVRKHQILLDALNGKYKKMNYDYIPNYMYYLVTPNLVEKAKKYLEENKLPYGLMVYHASKEGKNSVLESVKRVKRIHNERPTQGNLKIMMARMSNEYIYGFINMRSTLRNQFMNVFDNFFSGAAKKSVEMTSESIDRIWEESK